MFCTAVIIIGCVRTSCRQWKKPLYVWNLASVDRYVDMVAGWFPLLCENAIYCSRLSVLIGQMVPSAFSHLCRFANRAYFLGSVIILLVTVAGWRRSLRTYLSLLPSILRFAVLIRPCSLILLPESLVEILVEGMPSHLLLTRTLLGLLLITRPPICCRVC